MRPVRKVNAELKVFICHASNHIWLVVYDDSVSKIIIVVIIIAV